MNYKLSTLLTALFSILVLVSCGKDDEKKDEQAPSAIITSPENNALYLRGNTLYLNATFTDNEALNECTVYLTQNLKSAMGWDELWTPDEVTFPLSGTTDEIVDQFLFEATIPSDIMSTDYMVKVVVSDKALNFTTIEIPISIK
ncbi:DUF4625 domain-containing protein [Saccharicrinis aurantiacus]|uniref:DUF4625 domain-containing protein n=1 Tax=Saccharicrinis aurantiacus TaxID=1849719 RepID=UPI0008391729|nr:DUF4625 domain-containing protein [Saccharicrinis aurantiacus]